MRPTLAAQPLRRKASAVVNLAVMLDIVNLHGTNGKNSRNTGFPFDWQLQLPDGVQRQGQTRQVREQVPGRGEKGIDLWITAVARDSGVPDLLARVTGEDEPEEDCSINDKVAPDKELDRSVDETSFGDDKDAHVLQE